MRGAKAAPHLDVCAPVVRRPLRRIEAAFDAECTEVAAGLLEPGVHFVHGCLPPAFEWAQWQKAIRNLRRALDRRFGTRSDPDRDRLLNRPRVDACCRDGVKAPLEGHHALGPQLAHELDLFFETARASREAHAERRELD